MAPNKEHKKVKCNTNKRFSFKKAITKIKLDHGNIKKIEKLDAVAGEFMSVTQLFCNLLIDDGSEKPENRKYVAKPKEDEKKEATAAAPEVDSQPNPKKKSTKKKKATTTDVVENAEAVAVVLYVPDKNVDIPKVETLMSTRWQRCAWRQACCIVQSWFSNERTNRPVLRSISIQADTNVADLQPSESKTFDYWVKLATLETGKPVFLPDKLYKKAIETIKRYPCLFSGIKLEKTDGVWYLTLMVGKENTKRDFTDVGGVDIGMKSMLVSSQGQHLGQISETLRQRVEKSKVKFARKQRLNACLKKKGLPSVDCSDNRTERFVRNEAGRAMNLLISSIPPGSAVAVERLNVKDMKFESRQMNRWLRAAQLGFIHDHLKFKLDDAKIRYRSVQSAYSSQECSDCGYVDKANRLDQEHFCCKNCGFTANADFNAPFCYRQTFWR